MPDASRSPPPMSDVTLPMIGRPPRPEPEPTAALTLSPAGSGWTLAGASAIGGSHRREGKLREDAFRCEHDHGWSVIAVADGAGSRRLSRFGARVATDYAVPALVRGLAGVSLAGPADEASINADLMHALEGAFLAARAAVEDAAKQDREPLCDYGCTLVLLAHHASEAGDTIVAAQIGDGAVVAVTAGTSSDAKITLVVSPDSGKYGSETYFLTGEDALERAMQSRTIKRWAAGEIHALLAMTDGVLDCVYPPLPTLEQAARTWVEVARGPRQQPGSNLADDLVAWLAHWEVPGNEDDRTLVILLRERSHPGRSEEA